MEQGNNNESLGRSGRKTAAIRSGRSAPDSSAAREAAAPGFSVVASRGRNWAERRWPAAAIFGIALVVLFLFLWQGPFSALHEASAQSNVTGMPTVTGDVVEVGKTLGIDLDTFTDPDGYDAATLTYQWHADGVAITDAESSTYQIKFHQIGKLIHVVVSYTDDASNSESLESNAVGPARFVLPGTIAVGEVIRTPNGLVRNAPATYAWYANGTVIANETNIDHRIKFRETGMMIHVVVTLTSSMETFASLPAGPVVFNLVGSVEQNETLRLPTTHESNLEYAWYSGRDVREYRTSDTYKITSNDVGKQIFVEVTYVGATGVGAVVRSAAVGPVPRSNKVNHRPVAVTFSNVRGGFVAFEGVPAEVGETLYATPQLGDDNGFRPQDANHLWYSGGQLVHVERASNSRRQSSYTVLSTDIGKIINVAIEYTDGDGFDERVVSRNLGPVPFKANNPATGTPTISPWWNPNPLEIHQLLLVNRNTIEDLDGDSAGYDYQWLRNGVPIAGATDWSYWVQGDDGGTQLSVRISFVDDLAHHERLTTPEITIPFGPEIVAPEGAYLGKTLSVDLSRLSYPDMPAARRYEYRWQYVTDEDGEISAVGTIPGTLENGLIRSFQPTLTLTEEDLGKQINVVVSIFDDSDGQSWGNGRWANHTTPPIILRPLVKSPSGVNATLPRVGGSFTVSWGLSNTEGESPFGFMYRYRPSTSPDFTDAYSQDWEFAPGGAEVRRVEISGNLINGAEYFFEVTGLYRALDGGDDDTTTDSAMAVYQHRTRNC